MRRELALLPFVLSALAGCDQVYDVTIDLPDGAVVRGFGCADDAGVLAAQRLSSPTVNIVMDVVDLGTELLSCRTSSLFDYCATHTCTVRQRACYPVNLDTVSPGDALKETYAQLKADDAGISNIPTDRTVIIRFVATAQQTCDRTQTLDPNQVVGCVYSCPTHLNASGMLDLDIDEPPGTSCVLAVEACATFPVLP